MEYQMHLNHGTTLKQISFMLIHYLQMVYNHMKIELHYINN